MKDQSNKTLDCKISKEGASWLHQSPGKDWVLKEQGTYTYACKKAIDDHFELTPVVEYYVIWSSNASDPQSPSQITRVCRDALSTPQALEIRVESKIAQDKELMNFETRSSHELLTRVEYHIHSHQLQWTRFSSKNTPQYTSNLSLTDDILILPLMRNFLGQVIHKITQRNEKCATILVPKLTDPHLDSVFTPLTETREARILSTQAESIPLDHHSWTCSAYHFIGGPYDHNSKFWICQNSHRLIRYIFTISTGDHWLVELSYFKRFTTSA